MAIPKSIIDYKKYYKRDVFPQKVVLRFVFMNIWEVRVRVV